MLKAIIVDDEKLVRSGLRHHYHWDKYNIQIVEDFPDGEAAYSYLCQHPVDLLITDVVMPGMTGLELARRTRALENNDTKIIFISGYVDVKYLSGALRMEAVDYIFKPVDFPELDAAIERVVNYVQRHRTEQERQLFLEEQFKLNLEVLRQQRLVSLISYTDETEAVLAASCKTLGLSLDSESSYVVAVFQIANRWNLSSDETEGRGDTMLDLALQNSIKERLARYGNKILFKKRSYEYTTIIKATNDEYNDILLTMPTEIQEHLRQDYGAEVAVGISEVFTGLTNVRRAFLNACEAIHNRHLVDTELPNVSINKYSSKLDLSSTKEYLRMQITARIMEGEQDGIAGIVKEIMTSIHALTSIDEQMNLLLYLLLVPNDMLKDRLPEERGYYRSHCKLIERFLLLHGEQEQEDFFLDVFRNASQTLRENDVFQNNSIVKRITAFIDQHYMEALSIDVLADKVFLTPTYLCVVFKKFTGKTINSYITETRLEQSKKLLVDSNMHLQDICYKVGYLSPSYYARLFKKYYGLTPSEYRESHT